MAANHIRRLREAKGMEPTELAFRIGRSESALCRYETGETDPPLRIAQRIADVLGVTLNELFNDAPAAGQDAAA